MRLGMFSADIDYVVQFEVLYVLHIFGIFSTEGFCSLKVNLLGKFFFGVLATSLMVFVKPPFMMSLG